MTKLKIMEDKEKKYYIEDLESGQLIPVSKEYKEKYNRHLKLLWSRIESRLKNRIPTGKIICFGTGGDHSDEYNKHLEQVFYNPDGYKLIEFKK